MPVAPPSSPSASLPLFPYLSPYTAIFGPDFTDFTLFRHAFGAAPQSPSVGGASAALHFLPPPVAFDTSAAAAGASAVDPAGSATGALFFTDPDAGGVRAPGFASGTSHNLRKMCRNPPPLHPHSLVKQLTLQKQRRFFQAAQSSAASDAALSSLRHRANSPDAPSDPSSGFPVYYRSLPFLPHYLALRWTASLAAFLFSPFPAMWPAVHCLFRRVTVPALLACIALFSLLYSCTYLPLFSVDTGCRPRFTHSFPSLCSSSLLAVAAYNPSHSQDASSSRAVRPSPPTVASVAPPFLLVQILSIGLALSTPLVIPQLPAEAPFAPFRCGGSCLLPPAPSPVAPSLADPAIAAVTNSASGISGETSVLRVLSSVVAGLSSGLPSLLCVTAQPQRPRAHAPPPSHGGGHKHSTLSGLEEASGDATGLEGGGEVNLHATSAAGSDNPTVMRTAPTIRPRRRVPGRRSSSDWQQLFGDLRLVDLALPATLHSALTDVNSVKYFELAVAQKVPVSRQLLDGIRMFDVRAWKDEQDGQWYSEVPWRLEDDFRLLREYAPTADEASTSSFVSSMLRSLPLPLRPGGKDRARKAQQGVERRSGGGVRKVPSKVLSLVDLHSWTSLEEGLFKPIQDFLRTHISEVAVVVVSSFNGNRKTTMNAVPHAASLSSSLQRLAARQQQRQQEGTAAGSSSARLEGHPFYEDFLLRGAGNVPGSAVGSDKLTRQQQTRNTGSASGAALGAAAGAGGAGAGGPPGAGGGYVGGGGPVLSQGSMYTSPAFLDSLGASPSTYEVLDPLDTTCSFYMSSAVRKPLTYADVASFMALVDKYWGQLLPRHSHVFFGPADDSAYTPPAAMPAARAQPPAPSTASGTGAVGAPATGAASQAQQPTPAVDADPSAPPNSPAGSAPPPPQPATPPSSPRSLAAEQRGSASAASRRQIGIPAAPKAIPNLSVREPVGGATSPSAAAVESTATRGLTRRAGATAAKQPVATAATPVATSVGGARARAVAATDQRAAASRPTPPAAAAVPTSPTLDSRSAGGRSGATAAVFSAGFDAPPGFSFSVSEEGSPTVGRTGTADAASAVVEGGSDASANTRGVGADYGSFGATASVSSQIDSYPMYESLHRPEAFAEWLRAQGDLLLAKATLRDLLDAKIRLLLFVDDPLIAWYLTAFSREHVIVFVAADHTYDVLYKSEALFGPCALPNRASAAPNSMLLNVSREATWAGCRERCEATPALPTRPDEGRLVAKLRAARGRLGAPGRDTSSRSCTYWTFEPPVSFANLPPVLNNGEEVYPSVSPADLGLLPFTPLAGANRGSGKASKQQQDSSKSAAAAATLANATPLELKGECRIYAGPLTLAETVPLQGSIIQPRSCGLRTLYELPTQWASAAVFADLTDAVCPIFEVASTARIGAEDPVAGANGRAAVDALGEAAAASGKDDRQQKEPRSYQFFPELCMLDATPRYLRDAFQDQEEDDIGQGGETLRTNLRRWRGAGLERKLLRVYFSPPSPVPFVDGTRGGRREVGPVDAVSLMNELTATWALWQLERQQLVSSLTVLDTVDHVGLKEETYLYDQPPAEAAGSAPSADNSKRNSGGKESSSTSGIVGGGAGIAGFLGGTEPHVLIGRERPRSTRPVNALMVMRYDQTKSLIKNFSHLNYFEIIMNLNPQPKETRAIFFQSGEGAELSADRYVKVTAILNSLGVDEELGEVNELESDGFEADDTTEEEKRAQILMMWLAICAAVICFLIVAVGSTMRSAFFSKRVPRGGWTAAETPRRVSVVSEHSPHARRLESLS